MAQSIHDSAIAHTEPSRRAFEAAVSMEIHNACSTQTVGKARELDRHFPAYDDMLTALADLVQFADDHGLEQEKGGVGIILAARAAIAKAEGSTNA